MEEEKLKAKEERKLRRAAEAEKKDKKKKAVEPVLVDNPFQSAHSSPEVERIESERGNAPGTPGANSSAKAGNSNPISSKKRLEEIKKQMAEVKKLFTLLKFQNSLLIF